MQSPCHDGAGAKKRAKSIRKGPLWHACLAASRARALLKGRYHVAREDVQAVALPALRHRLVLSFEGEADGICTDDVIQSVIDKLA